MSNTSNPKLFLILVLILIGSAVAGYLTFYASHAWAGPERDYDERYEDIPGTPECWYDGHTEGNTEEACESATDPN